MALQVLREALSAFFCALGVVLGGSILGSLGAFFTRASPLTQVRDWAKIIRVWAIVVAIGGSVPAIRVIETGLFSGQFAAILRQLLIIISAMLGAYLGYWILIQTTGGE